MNNSSNQGAASFSRNRVPSVLVGFLRQLANCIQPFSIQRLVSGFGEISWSCTDLSWSDVNQSPRSEDFLPAMTPVHTRSAMETVYVESKLASEIVSSVLGDANVYSRASFSRLQSGVLETQLSSLLEGVGIAPGSCSAVLTKDGDSLLIRGILVVRGCKGEVLIRLPERALGAFLANPDLPEEFGKLSLPLHLSLARTSIAETDLELLQAGDAILFDDICCSSPTAHWQALLDVPGFQLGGQLSAEGEFSLTGLTGGASVPDGAEGKTVGATIPDANSRRSAFADLTLETAAIPLSLFSLFSLLKGEVISFGRAARNSLVLRGRYGVPIPVEAVWVDGRFGVKIIQPWVL